MAREMVLHSHRVQVEGDSGLRARRPPQYAEQQFAFTGLVIAMKNIVKTAENESPSYEALP